MKTCWPVRSILIAGLLLLVMAIAMPTPALAQEIPGGDGGGGGGGSIGQPAFYLQYWTVQPAELRRGEEFDLLVTFSNIGTWDANQVVVTIGSGGTFVGLNQSPRIDTMRIGDSATVALRGAVSSTVVTGYYAIPIEISYHHSALGGTRASSVNSIGVYVHGLPPSTGPDTGRPQIVIENSTIQPGSTEGQLLLTLTLRNTGNRWATGVIVNLGRSDVFSPADGYSTAFPLEGDIKLDETRTLTLPLTLLRSPGERVVQDFTIEYQSYSGGVYQSTQSVPIMLGGVAAESPRLLIESYTTDPATITAGATFRLDLRLVNVGNGPARRVFVRLGQNAATLGPLAPLGSSNVRYVEQIDGGTGISLSYTLAADGNASAGLVPIDVALEYEDSFGVAYSETETISLRVEALPYFQIGFFEALPDPILVGDVFDLPIEVINIGRQLINVSTVEVTGEKLRITGGTLYVGPLDAGTSGTLIAQAEALQAGDAEITVRVHYLDSFQQPQVYEKTLTITVESVDLSEVPAEGVRPSGRPGTAEAGGQLTFGERLWRGVLGFLGLGTHPVEEERTG